MNRNTAAFAWTFALALLAAAPLAAVAAPKDGGMARGPAANTIHMIAQAATHESVKLNDDQKSKVHAVIEDAMAQVKAMQEERKAAKGDEASKEDRKATREKVAELAATTIGNVEAVLTDEQKPAFRAALKEVREKAKAERGDGAGGKGKKKGDKPVQ